MRHSISGAIVLCGISVFLAGAMPQNASAQSFWKKLKQAAQQAAEQGQQPQISSKLTTGQSRQPQSQPGRAQNQSGQGQGQSGQVAQPAGTKVGVKMTVPIAFLAGAR